jgi:Rieske Fe-S protein
MLAGVGLVGLASAISACSSSSSSSTAMGGGETTQAGSSTTSAAAAGSSDTASAGTSASGGTAAGALTSTSAVPVGGGTVITAKKVVVTQPTAGEFKAFSAICTHLGCTVSQVSNGTIDCPCHLSQYNITTGAVVRGPAVNPLPEKKIKVSGGSIFLE